MSGIGKLAFQNKDWDCTNISFTIFNVEMQNAKRYDFCSVLQFNLVTTAFFSIVSEGHGVSVLL